MADTLSKLIEHFESFWGVEGFAWFCIKEAALRSRLEICICAAIIAENGEVIRGHRHMDCLRTASERGLKQRPGHEHQGFVTSYNRYVDRAEAARLQIAAGIKSADTEHPYLNGECYSEDLY